MELAKDLLVFLWRDAGADVFDLDAHRVFLFRLPRLTEKHAHQLGLHALFIWRRAIRRNTRVEVPCHDYQSLRLRFAEPCNYEGRTINRVYQERRLIIS